MTFSARDSKNVKVYSHDSRKWTVLSASINTGLYANIVFSERNGFSLDLTRCISVGCILPAC